MATEYYTTNPSDCCLSLTMSLSFSLSLSSAARKVGFTPESSSGCRKSAVHARVEVWLPEKLGSRRVELWLQEKWHPQIHGTSAGQNRALAAGKVGSTPGSSPGCWEKVVLTPHRTSLGTPAARAAARAGPAVDTSGLS